MSDDIHRDANLGGQYGLHEVEPPSFPTMTFSSQRYDPLRLPPTRPVGDGVIEDIFHDVQEMILTEIPPALMSSLAFPPPRAVVSQEMTRLDRDAGRRRDAWVWKSYDSYERAGRFVHSAKRGIAVCFVASKTAFHNAARCVCDSTMRVVWPLAEAVRGLNPGRAFIARVVLVD